MRNARAVNALLALGIAAASILLHVAGAFAPLENQFADARTRFLKHEVPSDIVIVGVDSRSLAELNKWPWPRRQHAELLERLRAVAPKRVFLDIDFSSRTNEENDSSLADELKNWPAGEIALPVFFQATSGGDTSIVWTTPIGELIDHAQLASVDQVVEKDGLVRNFHGAWRLGSKLLPSAPMFIANRTADERDYRIDFSIDQSSFGYLSYVDVLKDEVSASALAGKTVIIGAMATELNDKVPVPTLRSLPGPVVLALAAQTLVQGPPQPLSIEALMCASLLFALLCVVFLVDGSWRKNLVLTIAALGSIAILSTWGYSARAAVDVVPFAFIVVAAFAVFALRSLDRESLNSLMLALGLRRRDALMNSVVQSSSDGIVCIDGNGRIQTANAAAIALFDSGDKSLNGLHVAQYIAALENAGFADSGLLDKLSECEVRTAKGRQFPVEVSLCRVDVENEELYTLIARDISDRKAQERKLEYQARHDALTGLPNRAALNDFLDRALTTSEQVRPVALLMLDLCRFKEVNDTLGHNVGDCVLREVAQRFRSIVSGKGFLARIGGDEFTVVISEPVADIEIDQLTTAIATSMHIPIKANGIALDIGVSIGVALYPQDANDAQSLLKHADVAMYVAKRRGFSCERYDSKHDEHTVRRLAMIGELRSAIDKGGLDLHFQPQVNLRTQRIESAEALLRWRHPTMGAVNPSEFIAVAESTDLIQPLTEWTLKRALSVLQEWQRRGIDLRVAVNLSPRMLQDATFPQQLRELLVASAVLPSRLELEITENAMMLDPARALRVVNEVHGMGVIVSVDDYGIGFSSLGYLRDLPLHALKLDKSFVMHSHERADDRIIVESTVQLGHALKLQVVAEGVEGEWHARFLADMGYDFAQGYHFGKAMSPDDFFEWTQKFNGMEEREAEPAGSGWRIADSG